MKIKDKEIVLTGTEGKVTIKRMDCGFPRIEAEKEIDLHYALGYIHAYDRQMQMWLLKMIGTGRSSEFIGGYAELVELDKFMRWIKLDVDATEEVGRLSSEVAKIFEVYCRGVNDAVAASRIPYEFRLVGYKADRWSPEDVVLMVKLFGFMGLSQSQGDMEKFILQIIRNDIEPRKIKELFPYIREEISDALIAIIKQIKFVNPVVPESVKWLAGLPGFSASNNWAVGPQKTASGEAILCGDPHLTLQLPSIWYHAVMISENHFMMGATLPGIPSIILGRSANLAWAVTYGTMDMTDYFIEEVRDKKYRRGENWFSFSVREEIIRPKKKEPIVLRIYENDCGLLEGEPEKDGYYLNLAWSARKGTVAETAANFLKLPHVKTTQEAMRCFAGLPFAPFNWVMADARGNIGYQLSGLYPQKPQNTSGLLPYLAWDENQAWQGMIDPRKYPRAFNPKEGYIITANQDLNHLGEVEPMTLPMSSYRADRIGELLESATSLTADDMKKMQYDLYSRQARTFMEIIQPLLPETENGELLKNWDRKYDAASLGATLFERVYLELLKLVFGENGMGADVIRHVIAETHMFALLHGNFDRVMLKETSAWFGEKSRQEIYRAAIERGLSDQAIPYGKTRRIFITNIFFSGRLPKIFGFDYGPCELVGSRATIVQGQIVKALWYPTAIAPTYRMIADLAEATLHANFAGGASDRRFSKYYTAGLRAWRDGKYHVFGV